MTSSFVGRAFRKDLSRALADRVALALYLGIPLVIGFLILLLMGGERPKPVAHLLVADQDGTVVSELFTTVLRSEEASEFLRIEQTDRAAGRRAIDAGEASALLVIPAGFQDAVLRESPARLDLVTNPAESIKPKILTVGLDVMVDAVFYVHRILGDELRAIVAAVESGDPPTDEAISGISVGVNDVMRKVEKYLLRPPITVEAVTAQADPGERSGGVPMSHLMLPGIVVMGLFLMAQGLGGDVWSERSAGTLSRIASAPEPMAALLLGKVLAHAVLVFGVGLVLLAIGMSVLDIPIARLPVALVWTTLSGVTFVLLFTSIYVHAPTPRSGRVISNCVVFPLLMLGGSFFPAEVLPGWMSALGRMTPNGWALEHLKDVLLGRADATSLLVGLAVLLGAALVLFVHTAARLGGAFARR